MCLILNNNTKNVFLVKKTHDCVINMWQMIYLKVYVHYDSLNYIYSYHYFQYVAYDYIDIIVYELLPHWLQSKISIY